MAADARKFVECLSGALRQAAAIAVALEGRVANRPKTGESTAVKAALTLADTASQEALLVPLFEMFPEVEVEAEEDTPTVSLFSRGGDAKVVIDPIDGTLRSYLGGDGPYGVMAGLAVDGRYEGALVALPRERRFFEAVRGGGARMAHEDAPWEAALLSREGRGVIVSHEMPKPVVSKLIELGYEPSNGSGGAIAVAPLVPGFCGGLRLAKGPLGVSIRGRIGVLIAAEAGALLRGDGGAPFPDSVDVASRALLVARDAEVMRDLEVALGEAGSRG